MGKIILLSILASALTGIANGQGWQRRYGQASENEQGKYIARTPDGGFLVRASATDGDLAASALLRLDAEGDSVWVFTGGPYPTGGGLSPLGEDRAIVNAQGDVFSVFYDSLFKFNAGGQIVFSRPAGFFHILGMQTDGICLWQGVPSKDTLKLRKYDFDGNVAWEKTHQIPGELFDVQQAPDGRIAVLYTAFASGSHTFLEVFDSNGDFLFTRDFGWAFYYKISFDAAGNFILYETFLFGQQAQNNTVYILKADPNGFLIWKTAYPIAGGDAVQRIVPAPDGDLILIGTSWYDSERSPRLYRLGPDGKERWKRSYQMPLHTYFSDAVANPDGSFVVTGHVRDQPGVSAPTDAIVWKFNSEGLLYPNLLRGRIVRDTVPDCVAQPGEPGMANWKVRTGNSLSVSDTAGWFEVSVDSGTTALELFPPGTLWQPCAGFEHIQFGGKFLTDTLQIPVYPLVDCPQMDVSLGFQRLRRCFENTATVSWCNRGTVSEPAARILVVLPPELDFTTATWPPGQISGDSLWFDIGFVGVDQCGSFQLRAVVNCDFAVNGQALCTEAHIYPDTFCLPQPGWSGAHVQVQAQCLGDTVVEFTLHNTGHAPTSPGLEYIIIEDQVVLMTAPFNLPPAGMLTFRQQVLNGSLYRLEARQEPSHPGFSMPVTWVEGCGAPKNKGLSLQYPVDDRDLFTDIDCQRVIDSYDPNDKSAQPEGFDAQHLVQPNTDLTYRIRFQNTGTDTAFTVFLRDTLSEWLDPATLRPESASHPYTWNFAEGNILKFEFDNIRLPDSAANEAASQGFVQFRVSQKVGVPLGSVISNRAGIFFDFNPAVITNETFHTVGRDFMLVQTTTPGPGAPGMRIYPNPFRETTGFHFDSAICGVLTLYTLQGQALRQEEVSGQTFAFRRQGLPAGLYAFDIRDRGRLLAHGKIAAQ